MEQGGAREQEMRVKIFQKGPDLSLKIFMIDTQIMRKDTDAKKLPDYETYDYFTEQQKWLDQVRTHT